MHIVQVQVDAGRVQVGNAGVTDGREDPSQVGIAGEERRLDQRRMGNRVGDQPAFIGGPAALDAHRDELGRALAVPNDGLRQFLRYRHHRRGQGLALRAVERGDGLMRRLVACDHHKGVVG